MDAGSATAWGNAMSDVTMHPLNMSQVNDLRSLARQLRNAIRIGPSLRGKTAKAGKIVGAAKQCLAQVEAALIEHGWEQLVTEDRKL